MQSAWHRPTVAALDLPPGWVPSAVISFLLVICVSNSTVAANWVPGSNPITEVALMGALAMTILAIVRLGNSDLEAPNTPAMDAPDSNQVRAYQQQMAAQQMAAQQMAMMRASMMRNGPPNMGGQMPPPGMMPPGMMAPGGAPAVPVSPGSAAPTPLVPGKDAATSPVGKAPSNGTFGLARFLGSSDGK